MEVKNTDFLSNANPTGYESSLISGKAKDEGISTAEKERDKGELKVIQ